MIRLITNPRFLLPTIIFTGVLIIGIRVNDMGDALSKGKLLTSSPAAMAETKPAAKATPAKPEAAKEAAAAPEKPKDTGTSDMEMVKPATPPPDELETSPAETQLLEQLSQRRTQLEQRAKELDTRESLIQITEQRVNQKISEMNKLRSQLQAMVNQINESQTENLVKIYETMKPDEAARIFESLEMPVQLSVIQHMKPAHSALIMAKMAPEKAKDLTLAMTKQDQLPQVK